jgi:predicted 3-demethylubiquinone-9 3-methyltransferase (glyoxalase superfamily)
MSGVSWQIIPSASGEIMTDTDAEKARRVTEAMLQLKKFDMAARAQVYNT